MICDYLTENGPCQQQGHNGYCYYHSKLAAELLEAAGDYLSETEIDTLFGGRRRNDGRRLDHYVR